MRRNAVTGFLAAAVLILIACSPGLAEENLQSQALMTFRESVVKALPPDKSMARIAVLDFKGDDSMVKNAVISAINEKTPHRVIERIDFDKILAEQGLQLKDIMDEKTRTRHGRLKGVQGLLMGDVYSSKSGFMAYHIKANVRLLDVEKGEVAMSREFDVSAVSPMRYYLVMAVPALILLLLLVFLASRLVKRRRRRVAEKFVEKKGVDRREMTDGIDRIIGHVSEAKSRLVDKGKIEDAAELKNIERNLKEMRRSMEGSADGSVLSNDGRVIHHRLHLDREVFWKLEDMERLSGKISNTASSGVPGDVGKDIGILRAAVARVDSELKYGRPFGL
jgi:hypothetical protein